MPASITTNMNTNCRNDLNQLAEWLQRDAPHDILMPLIAKHPMEAHRGNVWSWEAFLNYPNLSSVSDFGILMKNLFCVDFDDADLFQWFREQHSGWFEGHTYALARTSKGYHYVCRRSKLCDDIPLFDKSRLLDPHCVPSEFLDDQNQVPIDIKTRCSTGTGGVLVVAPSHNKSGSLPLGICPPWNQYRTTWHTRSSTTSKRSPARNIQRAGRAQQATRSLKASGLAGRTRMSASPWQR